MDRRTAVRLAAWAALYFVVAWAGRQLVMPESGLAVVWPAAGIGALWLATCCDRRTLALSAGSVGAILYFLIVVEIGLPQAAWWSAAQVAQCLVAASLLRRRPGLGPEGLRRVRELVPTSPREVGALSAVGLAAASVGAVLGSLGVLDAGTPWSWWIPLSWVIRNATGIVVVVALAALASRWHADCPGTPRSWLGAGGRSGRVELAAAAVVAAAATALVFGPERHVPLAFLVIPCAVWFGLRFVPVIALLATTLQGAAVIGLTLGGRGPFAGEADLAVRATTVQLFFVLCCVLALILSMSVADRQALVLRVVRSEAQARERAEVVSAVTRVMHEGLLVVDRTGEVVMSNPAAVRMLGEATATRLHLDAESTTDGSRNGDGTPMAPEDRPAQRALRGEVVDHVDLHRTDPVTGARSVIATSAAPLHRSGDDPLAVLVLTDVTEDRARLDELKGFAGVMAHDLKGPVAGVRGWAEILEEQLEDLADETGADVTASRATLLRMQTTAQRVQELIDDLLAYAMAGSGELDLRRTTLRDVWRQAREQLPSDSVEGSRLSYVGPEDEVEVDVVLVRQLLVNLLGNAMKYVAPGVTPDVRVRSRVAGDRLVVEVVDNGIGIPLAEQAKVFDGFVRSSRTGGYPGTGLGLAICARAVQRHGGTIGARDAGPDGGTIVAFSLPLAGAEPAHDADTTTPRPTEEPEVATVDEIAAEPLVDLSVGPVAPVAPAAVDLGEHTPA